LLFFLFPDYSPERGRKAFTFIRLKGGEALKYSYEQRLQNQFGGFCTKVLRNEAYRIHNEYARQRAIEKSWDELTDAELLQTAVYDQYFRSEQIFQVLGQSVVVENAQLAAAIAQLSEIEQQIILLYFYFGMTDKEIATYFHVVRQAICKRRSTILKTLRKNLEKEGSEWEELQRILFR